MKVEAANINSNNDQEEQQQQMETDDAKTAAKEPQQQQSTTPPAAAGAMPMQLCKANFLSLSVPIAPSNANSCSRSPLLVSPMPSSSSTAAASSSTSPPRRKASAPVIGTGPGQIHADCLICSDRATGKHYGSISCDGCKGFFRRTIRKKHNYVCRFSRNCVVDKSQRNSCRRCRFDKCLANGMRPEAVQLERDRIAATRRSSVSNGVGGDARTKLQRQHQVISQGAIPMEVAASPTTAQSPGAENGAAAASNGVCAAPANIVAASPAIVAAAERQLQRLMDAERTLTSRHHSALLGSPKLGATTALASGMAKAERTAATPGQQPANFRTATTGDVTDSMHQQLILLVEWAKQLEEFRRLPLRSQIALLRHFSAQHLVLCAAFRSLQRCAGVDAVWLANDRFVPRDAPKIPDVNRVVARILDHLTGPMRHLHLEEREFVALKAVAFFDPMAKDVENCAVAEVEETRRRILGAFEHHVTQVSEHRAKMPLRLANLLLLLPPLMAIARDLVEEAQLAKLFGLANVDELMAELLLPEDAETRSYSRLRTSVTSSIVQSNVTSPTPPNTPHHSRGALLPPPSSHLHHHHHSSPLSPIVTAGSPQASTWVLAAPTPIYSPGTPFSLIGVAARSQQLSGGADRADKR